MAYLTAENGRTGFIGKAGKVALEARYEFVSAMSPDGYFVSKKMCIRDRKCNRVRQDYRRDNI